MPPTRTLAAGIDRCRSGWAAARLGVAGVGSRSKTELRLFEDLDEVIAWREDAHAIDPADGPVVALDVPMGLPSRAGLRACDREARRELGSRWMSVFAPPDRELLGLDFAGAREVVHRRRLIEPLAYHPVMTHQTINIAPGVAAVDRILRTDPRRQEWLLEVHPELSFRMLAGRPLSGKRTPTGAAERLALVAQQFPDAPERLARVPWRRRDVARDDLLDAYAALWTARRFLRGAGQYRELGDGGRDACGLRQRIIV